MIFRLLCFLQSRKRWTKSWDLTEEDKIAVEQGYEEIRAANNLEPDELNQEDLDKVMALQEGILPRYDIAKKKDDETKYVGR